MPPPGSPRSACAEAEPQLGSWCSGILGKTLGDANGTQGTSQLVTAANGTRLALPITPNS